MAGNIKETTPELTATAINRRNFIKRTCVATTALAACGIAAAEKAQGVSQAKGLRTPTTSPAGGDRMKSKNEFKPGDRIPTSGIYIAVHDRLDGETHAHPHEVTALVGKLFPKCRGCHGGVRFRLRESAEYVEAHDLFKA